MFKFIFFALLLSVNPVWSQNKSDMNKVLVEDIMLVNLHKDTDTSIIEYSGEKNFTANKVKKYYGYGEIMLSESYVYFDKLNTAIDDKMREEIEKKLKQDNLINSIKDGGSYNPNNLTAQVTLTKLNAIVIGYGFSFKHSYHIKAKISMLNKKEKEVYSYNAEYTSSPRKVTSYRKLTSSSSAGNIYDDTKLDLLYDTLIQATVNAFFSKNQMDDFKRHKDQFIVFDPNKTNEQSQAELANDASKTTTKTDSVKSTLPEPSFAPLTLKTKNKKTDQDLTEAINSIVVVKTGGERYSGIVLSDDGYILTTYSLLGNDSTKKCEVIFPDGKSYEAKIFRINEPADLVLLKVSNNNCVPLVLNNLSEAKITNDIYAVGSSSANDMGQSISKGIISGSRVIEKKSILQINTKINAWQFGGGLFLPNGSLIGIIYSKLIGRNVEGIGFALTNPFILKSLNLKYE